MRVIILGLVFVLAFASVSYAGQYASVNGRVYDANNPLSGIPNAEVTITCLSESTETVSGYNGDYFAMIDCPVGETVEVTAHKDANSGSNTGTITYSSISGIPYGAEVDVGVQSDPSIPEFPSAIIPAMLSLLSFGLIRSRQAVSA